MNSVTWEWLAGFIDGEGCFNLGKKEGEGKSGVTFQPRIAVYQNGEIGRAVLNRIQSFTGIGSVNCAATRNAGKIPYQWDVNGCGNIIRLCEAIHSRLIVKYQQCLSLYLYARRHSGCHSGNGSATAFDHFTYLVLTCALNARGEEDPLRLGRIERSTGLTLTELLAEAKRLISERDV